MDTFEILVQLFTFVLAIVSSAGGLVKVVDWLKAQLGTQGWQTHLLVGATATIFAIALGFVEGQITPDLLVWDRIAELFVVILGAAYVQYERLQRKNLPLAE